MPELFDGSHAYFARFAIQRLLGLIYLIAFLVAANQFVPLLGERGLMPIARVRGRNRMRTRPSLFHLHYTDRFFQAVAWFGVALSAVAMLGLSDAGPVWLSMLVWFVLWALYQSIVNVGQTFYAFGWETLLLEVGFLAIFLGPSHVEVPIALMLLLRWVLFRVEFGAGLIKIRGDPCWRDLTCLEYHHETQPLPNGLSWYAHHLPRWFHRLETGFNHFVQLAVPFALFAPQPAASVAGALVLVTQAWLVVSGNFSWLNALTMVLAIAALGDAPLEAAFGLGAPALAERPLGLDVAVAAVTALVLILSIRPVRNLLSRRQLMNASFDSLHLVNTYGAFGSVTRERYEIVLEGRQAGVGHRDDVAAATQEAPSPGPNGRPAHDGGASRHQRRNMQRPPEIDWQEYEFKAKPGDPARRPPQVAPYHLRLDWLMWFAALSGPTQHPWLLALVERLLRGDRQTLRLMRHDPFPAAPPERIRARFYRYRFTTPEVRRETGAWWQRELVGEYLPPLTLGPDGQLMRAPG